MAQITRLGLYGGSRPNYVGFTASASATLSGTSLTETQVVAGTETTVVTLVNDTFVATLGADNSITTDFINGILSDGVEATGFNNTVTLDYTNITRDSSTQVTIAWSAASTFDITVDESITLTIPATALTGAVETTATPTVDITADAATSTANTGGWFWLKYDLEKQRREEERKKRARAVLEAERIEDELTRQLALAEREIEAKADREAELKRLTEIAEQESKHLAHVSNDRIAKLAQEAIKAQTYSRMERFERELFLLREQEEFLLLATQILVNQ